MARDAARAVRSCGRPAVSRCFRRCGGAASLPETIREEAMKAEAFREQVVGEITPAVLAI
jgi:hypothetical protein